MRPKCGHPSHGTALPSRSNAPQEPCSWEASSRKAECACRGPLQELAAGEFFLSHLFTFLSYSDIIQVAFFFVKKTAYCGYYIGKLRKNQGWEPISDSQYISNFYSLFPVGRKKSNIFVLVMQQNAAKKRY